MSHEVMIAATFKVESEARAQEIKSLFSQITHCLNGEILLSQVFLSESKGNDNNSTLKLISNPEWTIGDIVRGWRNYRGLKVSELATACGGSITKGYISNLEHGKTRSPYPKTLDRLAKGLDIPVTHFTTRSKPGVTQQ